MDITVNNFEEEVLQSSLPVFVDFWADWCVPCKALLPTIDKLAEEFAGKAKVCKINAVEQQPLAVQHRIMSVPTFMVFVNGICVERKTNAETYENLKKMILNAL